MQEVHVKGRKTENVVIFPFCMLFQVGVKSWLIPTRPTTKYSAFILVVQ